MSGVDAVEVRVVELAERSRCADGLRALERGVRYPLGDDWFEIDHGRDAFAFFDRLGRALTLVALRRGEIIGTASMVLRHVPCGGSFVDAWYLCDFKVRADQRGRGAAGALLAAVAARAPVDCPRGYAVSMNPASGDNRVVTLARRLLGSELDVGPTLEFVTFDARTFARMRARLEERLGPLGCLSLLGVKDIVLASTGRPMPLVHVQHGPLAEPSDLRPAEGDVLMLALPQGEPLVAFARAEGAALAGCATVVHKGLAGADFRFILSSDV